jgi:hypothetical protein
LTSCATALALAALMLAACARPDPSTDTDTDTSAPDIGFLADSFDLEDIGWLSEQADEFGVDLEVSGLRAIDKDAAFLFGGVRVHAGTIRSFLLETRDGGKSWHETMPPVLGSELTHVAFADPQHGWALAQWAVEQAGPIRLFGSTDGGKTWRELGDFPGDGFAVSMTFTSALQGEIELSHDIESTTDDNREEIDTFASDDGGLTWSRIRRETRAGSPVATAAHRERGFDGSEWELETRGFGDPIGIRRFDREQSRRRVTTMPTHFRYEQGRVLTSP